MNTAQDTIISQEDTTFEGSQSSEQCSSFAGGSEVFDPGELLEGTFTTERVSNNKQVRPDSSNDDSRPSTGRGCSPSRLVPPLRKSDSMMLGAASSLNWRGKPSLPSSGLPGGSKLPVLIRSASVSAMHAPKSVSRPRTPVCRSRPASPLSHYPATKDAHPNHEAMMEFWLKEKQSLEDALRAAQLRAHSLEKENEKLQASLEGTSAKADDLEFRVLELEGLNESVQHNGSQEETWSTSGFEMDSVDTMDRYEKAVLEQLKQELDHDESMSDEEQTPCPQAAVEESALNQPVKAASDMVAAPLAIRQYAASRKLPAFGDSAKVEDLRLVLAMQLENESLVRQQLMLVQKQKTKVSKDVSRSDSFDVPCCSNQAQAEASNFADADRSASLMELRSRNAELAARISALEALREGDAVVKVDLLRQLQSLREEIEAGTATVERLLEEREEMRLHERILAESLQESEETQRSLQESLLRYKNAAAKTATVDTGKTIGRAEELHVTQQPVATEQQSDLPREIVDLRVEVASWMNRTQEAEKQLLGAMAATSESEERVAKLERLLVQADEALTAQRKQELAALLRLQRLEAAAEERRRTEAQERAETLDLAGGQLDAEIGRAASLERRLEAAETQFAERERMLQLTLEGERARATERRADFARQPKEAKGADVERPELRLERLSLASQSLAHEQDPRLQCQAAAAASVELQALSERLRITESAAKHREHELELQLEAMSSVSSKREEDLMLQLDDMKSEVLRKDNQLLAAKADISKAEQELSAARSDASLRENDLEQRLEAARSDASKMEEELAAAKAGAVEMEKRLEAANSDFSKLAYELSAAKSDAHRREKELLLQLETAESGITRMRNELEAMKLSTCEMVQELAAGKSDAFELESKPEDSKSGAFQMDRELNTPRSSALRTEQELALKSKGAKTAASVTKEELCSLGSDASMMKADGDACYAAATMEEELKVARGAAAVLEEELKVTRGAAAIMEKELKVVRDTAAMTDEELKVARGAAATMEEELKVARGAAATMEEELKIARDAAATMEEELKATRSSASKIEERLTLRLETIKSDASRTEERLEAAKSDASRVEKELEDAKSSASRTEEELKAARLAAYKIEQDLTLKLNAAQLTAFKAEEELKAVASTASNAQQELVLRMQTAEADVSKAQQALEAALWDADGLKKELDRARAGTSKAEKELAAARSSAAKFQEELECTKSAFSKAEDELRATRSVAAKMEQTLALQTEAARSESLKMMEELDAARSHAAKIEARLRLHAETADEASRIQEEAAAAKSAAVDAEHKLEAAKSAAADAEHNLVLQLRAAESEAPDREQKVLRRLEELEQQETVRREGADAVPRALQEGSERRHRGQRKRERRPDGRRRSAVERELLDQLEQARIATGQRELELRALLQQTEERAGWREAELAAQLEQRRSPVCTCSGFTATGQKRVHSEVGAAAPSAGGAQAEGGSNDVAAFSHANGNGSSTRHSCKDVVDAALESSRGGALQSSGSVSEKHTTEESEKKVAAFRWLPPYSSDAAVQTEPSLAPAYNQPSLGTDSVLDELQLALKDSEREIASCRSEARAAIGEASMLKDALAVANELRRAAVERSTSLESQLADVVKRAQSAATDQQQQRPVLGPPRGEEGTAELRQKIKTLLQTEEKMLQRVVQLTAREAELRDELDEANQLVAELEEEAARTDERLQAAVGRLGEVRELVMAGAADQSLVLGKLQEVLDLAMPRSESDEEDEVIETPPVPASSSLNVRLRQKMASLSWMPSEDDDAELGIVFRSECGSQFVRGVAESDTDAPAAESTEELFAKVRQLEEEKRALQLLADRLQQQSMTLLPMVMVDACTWMPTSIDAVKPEYETYAAHSLEMTNADTKLEQIGSVLEGVSQQRTRVTSSTVPSEEVDSNVMLDDIATLRHLLADKDLQLSCLREAVETVISNASLVPHEFLLSLDQLQGSSKRQPFSEKLKSIIHAETLYRKKSSSLEIELRGLRASVDVKDKEYANRIHALETALSQLKAQEARLLEKVSELELLVLQLQQQTDDLGTCLQQRDREAYRLRDLVHNLEKDKDELRQQLLTAETESSQWDSPRRLQTVTSSPQREGASRAGTLLELQLQMEVAQLEEQVRQLSSDRESKLEQLSRRMQTDGSRADEELKARVDMLERSERALLRKIEMLEGHAAQAPAFALDRPEGILRQRIWEMEQIESHLRQQISDLEHDREELHEIARADKNVIHEMNVNMAELSLANKNLTAQAARLEMAESSLTSKLDFAEMKIEELLERIERLEESEMSVSRDLEEATSNERALLERVESLDADLAKARQREREFFEKLRTATADKKLQAKSDKDPPDGDAASGNDVLVVRRQLHGAENEVINLKARVAELEAKEAALVEQLQSIQLSSENHTQVSLSWDGGKDGSQVSALEAKMETAELRRQLDAMRSNERAAKLQLQESQKNLFEAEKKLQDSKLVQADLEAICLNVAQKERDLQEKLKSAAAVEAKLKNAQMEMESLLCVFDEKQVLSIVERENFQLTAMNRELTNKLRSMEQKAKVMEERLAQNDLLGAKKGTFVLYEELSLLRSKSALLAKSEEHLREFEQSENRLKQTIAELRAGNASCGHEAEIKALKSQIKALSSAWQQNDAMANKGKAREQLTKVVPVDVAAAQVHEVHKQGNVRDQCLADLMAAVKQRDQRLEAAGRERESAEGGTGSSEHPDNGQRDLDPLKQTQTDGKLPSEVLVAHGEQLTPKAECRLPPPSSPSASDADLVTSHNSLWDRLELLQPKSRPVRPVEVIFHGAVAAPADGVKRGDDTARASKPGLRLAHTVADDAENEALASADEVSEIADDIHELRKEDSRKALRMYPPGAEDANHQPAKGSVTVASASEVMRLKQVVADLEKQLKSRETELRLVRISRTEWQKECQLTGDAFDMRLKLKEQQRQLEAAQATIAALKKEAALLEKISIDRQRELIEMRILMKKSGDIAIGSIVSSSPKGEKSGAPALTQRGTNNVSGEAASDPQQDMAESCNPATRDSGTEPAGLVQLKQTLKVAQVKLVESVENSTAFETKYNDARAECNELSQALDTLQLENTALTEEVAELRKRLALPMCDGSRQETEKDSAPTSPDFIIAHLRQRNAHYTKKCKEKNNMILKLMAELRRCCRNSCPNLLASAEQEVSDAEELEAVDVIRKEDAPVMLTVLQHEKTSAPSRTPLSDRDSAPPSRWLTEPSSWQSLRPLNGSQGLANASVLSTFFGSSAQNSSASPCQYDGATPSGLTVETNHIGSYSKMQPFLTAAESRSSAATLGAAPQEMAPEYVAAADYSPQLNSQSGHHQLELPLHEGQVIRALGLPDERGYMVAQITDSNQIGLVPFNYLRSRAVSETLKIAQERRSQLDSLAATCGPLSVWVCHDDVKDMWQMVTKSPSTRSHQGPVGQLAHPQNSQASSADTAAGAMHRQVTLASPPSGEINSLSESDKLQMSSNSTDPSEASDLLAHDSVTPASGRLLDAPSLATGKHSTTADHLPGQAAMYKPQQEKSPRMAAPSAPRDLHVERVLEDGRLIVSWKLPLLTEDAMSNGHKVIGYNVYVNGTQSSRVSRAYQHKTALGPLNLHEDMSLSVRTVSDEGTLSLAASINLKGLRKRDVQHDDSEESCSSLGEPHEDKKQAQPDGARLRLFAAVYDYTPINGGTTSKVEEQLSFKAGDIIKVYGQVRRDGFYQGEIAGVRGLVPDYFVEEVPIKS